MSTGIMRAMVRTKVQSFLPDAALTTARTAEASERSFLLEWAETIGAGAAP